MINFKIKEAFYIDDKPVKLISGAVHYFRTMPEAWKERLYNLKAMGCNTVETYIPWNLHEPKKGEYNFQGIADIEEFIEVATEMELYIILRPTPYICAEWEFGGLPAWLLDGNYGRIRSLDKAFLKAVDDYYSVLIPKLTPYQFDQGGNVLMMQIENEFGSFSNNKEYLKEIKKIMEKYGVTVPLFTSDGGWKAALEAGSLVEEGVLATANFGSDAENNFNALAAHQPNKPLMCMEFWDGWFNDWGVEIIRRDPQETAVEVKKVLEQGSINFYMFHGGTNFGFYNGASDKFTHTLPQITSYDYDAPLTEWGTPTEKFYAIQKVIKEMVPEAKTFEPMYPSQSKFPTVNVKNKTSLFSNLEHLEIETVKNDYPLTMEKIGQSYGYILYEHKVKGPHLGDGIKLRNVHDRAYIYVNHEFVAIKDYTNMSEPLNLKFPYEMNTLSILVENTGRNNYGPELIAESQQKGILGGVTDGLHFMAHWTHTPLEFVNEPQVNYENSYNPKQPSFYNFEFELAEVDNTFIDCSRYGKGVIYVNGFHIGRYWDIGPTLYLYVPKELLNKGKNSITVFETDGVEVKELVFSEKPIYKDM